MLALAGCGQATSEPRSEGSKQVPYAAPLGVTHPNAHRTACIPRDWAPTPRLAYTAVLHRAAAVFRRPSVAAASVRFARVDVNGYATVFGVLGARLGRGCRPTWFRVQLPVKPNGSSGWVRASSVAVYPVRTRIVVSLSTRRLDVYRGGRVVLRAPVAVGAPATPTPVGRFYVNERFRLSNANGPFGVAALGISAHSEVLTNWVQGGPIALHGTNEARSIGRAASHGCVRLANADMRRLFALAPAGTPVLIRS